MCILEHFLLSVSSSSFFELSCSFLSYFTYFEATPIYSWLYLLYIIIYFLYYLFLIFPIYYSWFMIFCKSSFDDFFPQSILDLFPSFFLFGGILGSASGAEFPVSLSNQVGFMPRLFYNSTHHSPESFTHLETGWAQDAWPQWSYEDWYFHLDISHSHLLFLSILDFFLSTLDFSLSILELFAIFLSYSPICQLVLFLLLS